MTLNSYSPLLAQKSTFDVFLPKLFFLLMALFLFYQTSSSRNYRTYKDILEIIFPHSNRISHSSWSPKWSSFFADTWLSLLLWLTFQMETMGFAADQPWPWRTLAVNWRVLALFISIFLGIFEMDHFIQGHDHNVVCIKCHQCKWWYISQSFFLVLWVLFHRWEMVKHLCSD